MTITRTAIVLQAVVQGWYDAATWGTVAEWFASLATLFTVIVGVITIRNANRQFQQEQMARSLEKIVEAAREARSRAGAIYVWLSTEREFGGVRIGRISLHVNNRTDIPCYDWMARVGDIPTLFDADSLGIIVPGVTDFDVTEAMLSVTAHPPVNSPRVEIEFTASNGERLRRRFDGQLEVV